MPEERDGGIASDDINLATGTIIKAKEYNRKEG